ncbi:MAG: hypothetical protein RL329_3123, partial [Bacteroidota bacterium]
NTNHATQPFNSVRRDQNIFSILSMQRKIYLLGKAFCLFILFSNPISAQNQSDTLSLARDLSQKGQFEEAIQLLTSLLHTHPNDVNVLWVLGQNHLWKGQLPLAKKFYKKALSLTPDNDYLCIDYARALLEMGEVATCVKILGVLERRGKVYADAKYLKAKALYWQGDYGNALKAANQAIQANSTFQVAKDLRTDILITKSAWLEASSSYFIDNQPFAILNTSISTGFAVNHKMAPYLRLDSYQFSADSLSTNAQMITIGNVFSKPLQGFSLKTAFGLANYPNKTMDWTGEIQFSQKIAPKWDIALFAEHKPFFTTAKSADTMLSTNHALATLHYKNPKWIEAALAYDIRQFADKNELYTWYGWGLSPSLIPKSVQKGRISLQLGYAFSYADAQTTIFESRKTMAQIVTNYDSTIPIQGFYKLYFTPKQQVIHFASVSFQLEPSQNWTLGFNGNYGLYAKSQNPYLYLAKDAAGTVAIAKDFLETVYTPYDISTVITYQFANKYALKATYTYRSTFFYQSQYLGLQFKMNFWHE